MIFLKVALLSCNALTTSLRSSDEGRPWFGEVSFAHRIVVFTDDCSLCTEIVDEIEAGKCAQCKLAVYNISDHTALAERYGIRVAPTVIIDEEVKIEGRPDIPFVCSNETYAHFKQVYPLTVQLTRPSDQANDHLQST